MNSVNFVGQNSDAALMGMSEYDWITYLTANRMCLAIKETLLQDKYMSQVFNSAIYEYRRDDFTSRELPALAIYEPSDTIKSRFFAYSGMLTFDMFLPIKLTRQDTTAVFNTLGKAFVNVIQSTPFWFSLVDKLIPLPPPSSPIYNDVLNYKNKYGSPLVDFAKECEIIAPIKNDIVDIGDVWKLQIKTSYLFDKSNYYAMLEDFGINSQLDPNLIFYQLLQDFSVEVSPITD